MVLVVAAAIDDVPMMNKRPIILVCGLWYVRACTVSSVEGLELFDTSTKNCSGAGGSEGPGPAVDTILAEIELFCWALSWPVVR